MLRVALPTFVFVETGSGSATALLFVYQSLVGAVAGPFAGALVDRLDLRSLARLVGAPIGGLLVAWRGLGPIVLIDARPSVLFRANSASPASHHNWQ